MEVGEKESQQSMGNIVIMTTYTLLKEQWIFWFAMIVIKLERLLERVSLNLGWISHQRSLDFKSTPFIF